MNRRGFLNSILMSAAFVTLSKVLPGAQAEFVEQEVKTEVSIECDPDRLYWLAHKTPRPREELLIQFPHPVEGQDHWIIPGVGQFEVGEMGSWWVAGGVEEVGNVSSFSEVKKI